MSGQQKFPFAPSQTGQRAEVTALLAALKGPESGLRVWGEWLSIPPSTRAWSSGEQELWLSHHAGYVCHGHGLVYGVILPWGIGKGQSGSGGRLALF